MPFSSKRADLLERSLEGCQSADQEVCDLVATVSWIPALTSTASAPRAEFVSALGLRLHAEALTLSAGRAGRARSATAAPDSPARPRVLMIGRKIPRAIAGATASLLVVGTLVGGASRSALPGSLLYPVKQVLDSTAVALAGSDFDRAVTLLSQAQEHITEAGALVHRDGSRVDPASVDEAVLGAHDAASSGQRTLLSEFDRTGNTQALIAVQDFVARSLPQLDALRLVVPAASRPDVDALIALLQQTRTTLTATFAVCGPPCASLRDTRFGTTPASTAPSGLASTGSEVITSTPAIGGLPNPTKPTLPSSGVLPVPDPTAAVTRPGGVILEPSVSIPRVTPRVIPRGIPGTTPPLPVPVPVPLPTLTTALPLPPIDPADLP